jgi:hypothetical protein
LHGFEQLRGKVVGLKMKDAVPTRAERLDIRRRQERVDPRFLNSNQIRLLFISTLGRAPSAAASGA